MARLPSILTKLRYQKVELMGVLECHKGYKNANISYLIWKLRWRGVGVGLLYRITIKIDDLHKIGFFGQKLLMKPAISMQIQF